MGGPSVIISHSKRQQKIRINRRQSDHGNRDWSDVATNEAMLAASNSWNEARSFVWVLQRNRK